MPKRIPVQRVHVHRDIDGVRQLVVPTIGVPFDFTADELADFARINPRAVSKIAEVDLSEQDEDGSDEETVTPKLTKAQQTAKDKADAAEAAKVEAARFEAEKAANIAAGGQGSGDETL